MEVKLSRLVSQAEGKYPFVYFCTNVSAANTYCQLQSQFELLVLQKLLDLCGYGHWNEPPNKVITCHIYNICAVNKTKKVSY